MAVSLVIKGPGIDQNSRIERRVRLLHAALITAHRAKNLLAEGIKDTCGFLRISGTAEDVTNAFALLKHEIGKTDCSLDGVRISLDRPIISDEKEYIVDSSSMLIRDNNGYAFVLRTFSARTRENDTEIKSEFTIETYQDYLKRQIRREVLTEPKNP